ncbi:MAG: hypothetical protein FWG17_03160 [Desulfovibrionaceae bacterium]|nr:hypothetical protein [Desulfovibrionaceae bacterium]
MNIILLGFKASGKSTLGRTLAQILGRKFLDTDILAEDLYATEHPGKHPDFRSISRAHGMKALRDLEARVIQGLRSAAFRGDEIIATGGGIILREKNMEILGSLGPRVFLDTSMPLLEERLRGQDSPLFADKSVAELHWERYPLYLRFSDLRLPIARNLPPEELSWQLLDLLQEAGYGQ